MKGGLKDARGVTAIRQVAGAHLAYRFIRISERSPVGALQIEQPEKPVTIFV
jgi:hypothetical protein